MLAAMLFVVSTLIVGGLGSAQMWDAGIARTLIPYGRILPVILVAELLAYAALMLGQFGGSLRGLHILTGIAIGIVTRLGEALLAAAAHSPEQAETLQQAFLLYYAEYFPGVLVQIAVTVLLLWLIKGAFGPARATLQPAIRPSESPETIREQEPTRERRRELIEQLMRREGEDEPEGEAEQPPIAPEPKTEPKTEPETEPERPRFELRPVPRAPQPAEHGAEPEIADPEPEVIALPAPEQPAAPALSSREAILRALDDDAPAEPMRPEQPAAVEDDEPPNVQVIQPHLALEDALEEPEPEPEPEPESPTLAPSEHGLFTYEIATGAAPVADAATVAAWADAAARALLSVGASRPATGETPSGRAIAWALDLGEPGENAPAVLEDLLCAASRVLETCGYGAFARGFLRIGRKYLGIGAVSGQDRGLVIALTLPGEANLGIADLALGKVTAALQDEALPAWSPISRPEPIPAYPDEDLQGRISPLFADLPEAAGLIATASYCPGRQVVVLAHRQPGSALSPGDAAAVFGLCEDLCFASRLADCDRVVLAGETGSVVLGLTQLGGQYVLVALGHPGVPGAAAAGTRLDQLLRAVTRRQDAATSPGE